MSNMNGSITGMAEAEVEAAAMEKYGEFFRAEVAQRGGEWIIARAEKVFPPGGNARWTEMPWVCRATRDEAERTARQWVTAMALREYRKFAGEEG